MNIGRTGKFYLLKLTRLKGEPHDLALGAAIGVFVGLTPTMPFHTIIILALALITRSSLIAGITTSWIVCNPLTYIPQYYFAFKIGNVITPYHVNWLKIKSVVDVILSDVSISIRLRHMMNLGSETIIVMVSGGILLAIPFAIASYYGSYFMFLKLRDKRREKQVLH